MILDHFFYESKSHQYYINTTYKATSEYCWEEDKTQSRRDI